MWFAVNPPWHIFAVMNISGQQSACTGIVTVPFTVSSWVAVRACDPGLAPALP